MNKFGQALGRRFAVPAPTVDEPATTPKPAVTTTKTQAETPNDNVSTSKPAVQPVARKPRRILDAGEEAKLGKRKNTRIEGQLRGGRNSPDWGEAVEWLGAMVPDGVNGKLKDLANGHRLHRWQVLVEALDCFEAKHGPRLGSKTPK